MSRALSACALMSEVAMRHIPGSMHIRMLQKTCSTIANAARTAMPAAVSGAVGLFRCAGGGGSRMGSRGHIERMVPCVSCRTSRERRRSEKAEQ